MHVKKLDMLQFAQSKMQYCSSLMLNGKHLFQIYKLQWRFFDFISIIVAYCELDRFLKCEVVPFLKYLFKT